ncbi:MAG: hypothetical protein QG567_1728 [Campylobacterota bacterium]|nr:hypothetical protein [Campylobacterota bacterium]
MTTDFLYPLTSKKVNELHLIWVDEIYRNQGLLYNILKEYYITKCNYDIYHINCNKKSLSLLKTISTKYNFKATIYNDKDFILYESTNPFELNKVKTK